LWNASIPLLKALVNVGLLITYLVFSKSLRILIQLSISGTG
jgi:hypothetical protein